jgi:hypothetical protein
MRHRTHVHRPSSLEAPGSSFAAPNERGQPLAPEVRTAFEPLFNHSFANVRVYADNAAHQRTANERARALTEDSDLHFGMGEYAPHTSAGRELIAHELTHVVQNERYGSSSDPRSSHSGDAAEVEARSASSRAVNGQPVTVSQAPSAACARDGDDDDKTADPPAYPFLPAVPNVQLTPPSLLGGSPADRPAFGPTLPPSSPGPMGPLAPFNLGLHQGDPISGGVGYGQPLAPMFPPLDPNALDVPRLQGAPEGPQLPGMWNRLGLGLQFRHTEDETMVGGGFRVNF